MSCHIQYLVDLVNNFYLPIMRAFLMLGQEAWSMNRGGGVASFTASGQGILSQITALVKQLS